MSTVEHETGAKRSGDTDGVRFDLVSPVVLLSMAATFAEGAHKYGVHNYQKGFKISGLINHAMNHIQMFMLGDTSEDHLAHAAWNINAAIHFMHLKPEMDDRYQYNLTAEQIQAIKSKLSFKPQEKQQEEKKQKEGPVERVLSCCTLRTRAVTRSGSEVELVSRELGVLKWHCRSGALTRVITTNLRGTSSNIDGSDDIAKVLVEPRDEQKEAEDPVDFFSPRFLPNCGIGSKAKLNNGREVVLKEKTQFEIVWAEPPQVPGAQERLFRTNLLGRAADRSEDVVRILFVAQ